MVTGAEKNMPESTTSFGRIYLPFAIVVLEDGSHMTVNRKYKPLGVASSDHVDYETHPSRAKIKGLTDACTEKIGMAVHKFPNKPETTYYLYHDETNPAFGSFAGALRCDYSRNSQI
jgi:hypothetical protein